jgi:PAS domain S-box-containing protein
MISQYRPDDWSHFLVDAAPTAILMIDAERTIVLVNRAVESLFGYTREELVGQLIEILVPERARETHPAQVGTFLAAPEVRRMGAGRELYGRRKDGTEVPIEIGLNPVATPDGQRTMASIIDITERKRGETRFQSVVEAAPNAMVMIDRDRRIALINRATETLFGYGRADLVGRRVEMLIPERFRDDHAGFVSGFLTAPGARAMGGGRDLYALRRDGSEVPVEIGLNPIETAEGLFILASIIDITERKSAFAVRERLAAIVQNSEDAIASKTLDGEITSWNAGAERMFGYTAAEAIGHPIRIVVPDRCVDEEVGLLDRMRRGEPISHLETVRRHKDGREFQVSATLSPIRGSAREIVGVASIVRELKRSNAELEQFAYIASHDLQEPLRMVANYTELLAQRYRGKLDERADKYIHYASDGARRMQLLVADLLAYARVGSQGKPLVRVSTLGVVRRVLESLRRAVREAAATVEFDELPDVLADEVQLQQLFQNLLGNAVKFRSEAPLRIAVVAAPAADGWKFSITDNGIGIEMRYAERIFQMFQRLHERGKYDGSGIGLAIAKRIVERHGGRIWLESEPGVGTTFHFTLPCLPKGTP